MSNRCREVLTIFAKTCRAIAEGDPFWQQDVNHLDATAQTFEQPDGPLDTDILVLAYDRRGNPVGEPGKIPVKVTQLSETLFEIAVGQSNPTRSGRVSPARDGLVSLDQDNFRATIDRTVAEAIAAMRKIRR